MKINVEKNVAQMYYKRFVTAFRNRQYSMLRKIFDSYLDFIEQTTDLNDEEISEIDLMFDDFISKHRIIKKYLYKGENK